MIPAAGSASPSVWGAERTVDAHVAAIVGGLQVGDEQDQNWLVDSVDAAAEQVRGMGKGC